MQVNFEETNLLQPIQRQYFPSTVVLKIKSNYVYKRTFLKIKKIIGETLTFAVFIQKCLTKIGQVLFQRC